MNLTIVSAVLLGFLALVATSTALFFPVHYQVIRNRWKQGLRSMLWELISCELGAITLVYSARNNSGLTILASATPLTAVQASQVQKITGLLAFGVGDGLALFTHNFGLDASAASYYEPEILPVPASVAGGSFVPCITYSRISGNVIQIGIPAGTSGTFEVTVRRPHSTGY
jgi:hypothetical protein